MVMTLMSNPKGAVATIIVAADGSGDTTDIQTGINLLPATGGIVYIKEGTYTTEVNIVINVNNTSLIGAGRSTIIETNTINIEIIYANNLSNLLIDAISFDGNSVAGTTAIQFDTCTDSKISNCWIDNCRQQGIFLSTSSIRNLISGCTIENSGLTGSISIVASARNIIVNNHIIDSIREAILIATSIENTIVAENIIISPLEDGIKFLDGERTLIIDNIIFEAGDDGITATGINYCTIKGNVCFNCSQSAGNTYSGIHINSWSAAHYSRHNIIVTNHCYDNQGGGATQKNGIEEEDSLPGDSDFNIVTNNVCQGSILAEISLVGANDINANNMII